MKQKHFALILIDLAVWGVFSFLGIRAIVQSLCPGEDFALYLVIVGAANAFFAVYKAIACGLIVLLSSIIQIALNAMSVAIGAMWFSPYLSTYDPDAVSCAEHIVYTTFAMMIQQVIYVVAGSYCVHRYIRGGKRGAKTEISASTRA